MRNKDFIDILQQWGSDQEWKVVFARAKQKSIRKQFYFYYLRSAAWKRKRQAAIKRAEEACELCHINQAVQAHHLTYKRLGWEKVEDLQAVCAECHKREHGIKGPSYERTRRRRSR